MSEWDEEDRELQSLANSTTAILVASVATLVAIAATIVAVALSWASP